MTLEERLVKRLREWQKRAAQLRSVMATLHPEDDARPPLEIRLAELEEVIGELAADLSARSSAGPLGGSTGLAGRI